MNPEILDQWQKAGDGDQAAARSVIASLYPLVIKIVRAHLPRRSEEEDLAQDIFVKIFEKRDQYKGSAPLEHWVSRIAVSTCLDALRRQRHRPEWRLADLTEEEENLLNARAAAVPSTNSSDFATARDIVSKLLQCLPPEDRLVLTLLELKELSIAEISSMTGWNRTLVKVRAYRARKKMKKNYDRLFSSEKLMQQ